MRWRIATCMVLLCSSKAWCQDSSQAPPVEVDQSTNLVEKAAIKKNLASYAVALNAREFEKLSELLDPDVRYVDLSMDVQVEGRDALLKQIRNSLEGSKDVLDASIESIEFTEQRTAIVNGTSSLGSAETGSEQFAFTAALVKSDETWLIQSITERAIFRDPLAKLAWLQGDWQDQGSDLVSSVRFLPGQQFLIRTFRRGDQNAGFQVIGYDSTQQTVRSWSYFADGSFGEGTWSESEGRWTVKSVQNIADGTKASGTYIITPRDADSMSVKLVGHSVDGEPVPSSQPMVVTRITTDKVAADETTQTQAPEPNDE